VIQSSHHRRAVVTPVDYLSDNQPILYLIDIEMRILKTTKNGASCSNRRIFMNIRVILIVTALFMFAGSTQATENTFRCGQKLVHIGETKIDVLDKCGEPQLKELVSGADERRVEQWVYKRSTRQLTRILTFEGTRLVMIETIIL
jgi:hypothetical protein